MHPLRACQGGVAAFWLGHSLGAFTVARRGLWRATCLKCGRVGYATEAGFFGVVFTSRFAGGAS